MKVSELEGPLLDCWVAKAEGLDVSHIEDGRVWLYLTSLRTASVKECPRFSTRWDDGGPLIERGSLALVHYHDMNGLWACWPIPGCNPDTRIQVGTTPLLAAMRAVVFAKYGEEVPE